MGYNVRIITLDSQPKYIPFNVKYIDVITSLTTADISKVRVSIDGGPQVPLNDFVPIPIPVRQMVLRWDASETGKKIAFLMVDTPITKIKQAVTLLTDESGIKADLDTIMSKTNKLQFDTDNDLFIVGRGKEGTPTDYTTTDSWADVTTLNVLDFNEVTILIKNTGSNPADVAVYVKTNATGSIEYEEVAPTTLNSGDVLKVQLSGRYSQVIIRAKNNISGSSTTIRIEWVGGK